MANHADYWVHLVEQELPVRSGTGVLPDLTTFLQVTNGALTVTRDQILAFRRRSGGLDARRPKDDTSLRHAAWAGLQDSMPRAALFSIHARVEQTEANTWDDPAFVQIWGPRYSVFVVAADDVATFTLGRLPDDAKGRGRAQDLAARLDALLDGRTMPFGEAGRALRCGHLNELRYAATTGTVVIRWDGARQPTVRTVQAPDVDPTAARQELLRRHLHVCGPATAETFDRWAGIRASAAVAAVDRLRPSLTPVSTPIGPAWILSSDEEALRAAVTPDTSVRLLPSGDSYYLLQGADRELLVPDAERRAQLWTSRVWPGAILAHGEIVGTWRRAKNKLTIQAWNEFGPELRDQVSAEAIALPLQDTDGPMTIFWGE